MTSALAVAEGDPMVTTLGTARRAELDAIAAEHGGLTPALVLDRARDPRTALHSLFEWDDSVAGERYRLLQAQNLIRVVATIIPVNDGQPVRVRAYVSLGSERGEGFYRPMRLVMADPKLRAQAVADALAEFEAFQRKWQHLDELASFFEAARARLPKLEPATPPTPKATRSPRRKRKRRRGHG